MEIDARPLHQFPPFAEMFGRGPGGTDAAREPRGQDGPDVTTWDATRDRLADRWPLLTQSELDATHGQTELVAALLQAKLAYAQRLAEESVGHHLEVRSHSRRTHGWLRLLSLLGLSGLGVFGLSLCLG